MMKITNVQHFEPQEWAAIKRDLIKKFYGIVGRPTRIFDAEGELGYTTEKGDIYLAKSHEMMNSLDKPKAVAFISGVFAHEALHQKYSNFWFLARRASTYPEETREIFQLFTNVFEDAAIENAADAAIGGTLLKSLRFSIAWIYKNTRKLQEAQSPWEQLVIAMIQFGDMGLLKGKFTFPEAQTAFAAVAPLFAQAIEEPDGAERVRLAEKAMELARPVWEKHLKDMKKLQELMKQLGKSNMSNKGKGKGERMDSSDGEETKASKRRKITITKITKEEAEAMMKNGEADGDGGTPPDNIAVCDEMEGEGKSKGKPGSSVPAGGKGKSGSEDGDGADEDEDVEYEIQESDAYKAQKAKEAEEGAKPEDGESGEEDAESPKKGSKKGPKKRPKAKSEKGDNGEANGTEGTETTEGEGTKDTKGKSSRKNKGKPSMDNLGDDADADADAEQSDNKDNPFYTPPTDTEKKVKNLDTPEGFVESDEANIIGEISEEEYSLSDDDIARITEEVAVACTEYQKEKTKEDEIPEITNYPITSPKLGKRTCLNLRVEYTDNERPRLEESYEALMTEMSSGISSLTTQIRRIFDDDVEEREYRGSGRINVSRMHSGRVTARIFDRHVAPVHKSDLSVVIFVDESGSMSCNEKYVAAKKACVALAEVFARLRVPVYITGFTADTKGYDIVHNHYIAWKNTPSERLKLLNITARANNCDGYSIRYATEVLKKTRSEKKLMIVLSDGQPAACSYYDGVADTKQAIKDAKKHFSVLGVAIGNNDTATLHHMYEKDFVQIDKVDDLFSGLARKLQTIVKTWE